MLHSAAFTGTDDHGERGIRRSGRGLTSSLIRIYSDDPRSLVAERLVAGGYPLAHMVGAWIRKRDSGMRWSVNADR